jgi:CDGSH-type Zn-finger protein
MSDNKTKITLMPNGPAIVEGNFEVFSPGGQEMAEGKGRVALCRCGASSSKPFCDGAHSRSGFQG